MDNKKILRFGGIAAIVLLMIFGFSFLSDTSRGYQKVETSVALAQLDAHNVSEAQIDDREQRLKLKLKEPITVEKREGVEEILAEYPARTAPTIFQKVEDAGAEKYTTKVTRDSFIGSMLSMMLPLLLMFAVISFLFSRMQGGGMGMFGMGQSRARELNKDMPTNTFADVAGADEAVDELHEIKDFLQDPSRYEALGAKIPRGVLLYGPPGTGKTLLARAVAGEAGVPFFSISGSDFVEMFVGVGASRVRDLFKQARENSPCIIFVDEIDAVGRQRGSGMGGGHDEREQTLNQMLVEMDGFDDREGVILMAATNRPDILDPALLRPGRFDRQIPVGNPDLAGREKILEVHAKGKPFAPDADLKALAKRTVGMSGADLANVLNEAALLTARIGGNVITADALEEATDRVIGGPRRSSKIISEKEKKVTAYHEGGHTLAAWAMKDIDRVYKVTILARGRTGGHAMTAPEDDKGMYNRNELFARIVFAMGGRSAEELVFGEPTTGASNDIEQATKIARAMITEYGMSPELGTVKYGEEQGDVFAGRGGGGTLEYSPEVANKIDEQVRYLVNKGHEVAYNILKQNRDYLDTLAYKLLEKETLRRPDLEAIFTDMPQQERIEVFPGELEYFPGQQDREPVKTPTEEALERGEEPPKRFSILEASRAAREKRQKELAAQAAAGVSPVAPAQGPQQKSENPTQQLLHRAKNRPQQRGFGVGENQGPTVELTNPRGETTGRHAAPLPEPQQSEQPQQQISSDQPPAGWTAPGWPPAKPHNNNPYAHPGMSSYGLDEQHGAQGADSEQTVVLPPREAMIGFSLPEHEKPDHPEQPAQEQPEQNPEPNQPVDTADATEIITPQHREDETDNSATSETGETGETSEASGTGRHSDTAQQWFKQDTESKDEGSNER